MTVSGDESLIDLYKSQLDENEIFARKINTGVAYHSPQMSQVAEEYISLIHGLDKGTPSFPRIEMISSTTGDRVLDVGTLSTTEYWAGNMVQMVRFSQALSHLMILSEPSSRKKLGTTQNQRSTSDLIEIGPHSTLQRPIKDIVERTPRQQLVRYHSALSRFQAPVQSLLGMAGRLYSLGFQVDLPKINELRNGTANSKALSDLPEYTFDHSRVYRNPSRLTKNINHRLHPQRDLLGAPVEDWNSLEARWRKTFDPLETPWILDHVVSVLIVAPKSFCGLSKIS